MSDQALQDRIKQLEAEVEQYKAEQAAYTGSFAGALHPPIEPRFFVGSLVNYDDDCIYRVIGRSIDREGAVTYDLEAVAGVIHHRHGNDPVRAYPLDHPEAATMGPAQPNKDEAVTYAVVRDESVECVYSVAENELMAFRTQDISLGRKKAEPVSGDGVVDDNGGIVQS